MKLLRPSGAIAAAIALASLVHGALVHAKPWWMRGVDSNESDFLPPDIAFRVSSREDNGVLRVRWVIADGYYLYRQKMQIKAESPDLVVSAPTFPRGTIKSDPYLGTQEIFTQQITGTATYSRIDAGAHPLQIKVTYQGCAEAGLCYPPITKVLFPVAAPPAAMTPSRPWVGFAIVGGTLAFFFAGLLLRNERRLDVPG